MKRLILAFSLLTLVTSVAHVQAYTRTAQYRAQHGQTIPVNVPALTVLSRESNSNTDVHAPLRKKRRKCTRLEKTILITGAVLIAVAAIAFVTLGYLFVISIAAAIASKPC